MANKPSSPNDDRAKVKNPNNPAYEADRINRERQGHGNAPPPAPAAQPSPPKEQPKK
ncbi:hypothetical protein [Polyangium spumosum]|uniref:Uncharacterized protein n=1 Tax=Polyangium spumosum TaxID=889282 RepID=A0A6N7Q298_9BACT|nr:hypothetical protein [Polyangium spumosum]MRG98403.1 hypothetical protein [Polyangium spumosum]